MSPADLTPAAAPAPEQPVIDSLFDLAPVAMWLHDASAMLALFRQWRAEGVEDLMAHLLAKPHLIRAAWSNFKPLQVNQRAIELARATSPEQLMQSLWHVVSGGDEKRAARGLQKYWNWPERKRSRQLQGVNFALDGHRIDVRINLTLLRGEGDWSRMLVAIEDISMLLEVQHQLSESERYALQIFDHSPVSLWVQDMSGIRDAFSALRHKGITDLAAYMLAHPQWVQDCMDSIRFINVNARSVELFQAKDKQQLLSGVGVVLGAQERERFSWELLQLWNGQLHFEQEAVKRTFLGEVRHIRIEVSVMEGHEDRWDRVLLSMIDVTGQKKARDELIHANRHDSLTQLANRSWFNELLASMSNQPVVSMVALDLNGLKEINDTEGHAAGDRSLARMGRLLLEAQRGGLVAARLGGDEFAAILPGVGARGCRTWIDNLMQAIALDNQTHASRGQPPISVALGGATRRGDEPLSVTMARADARMYEAKRHFYRSASDLDRRMRNPDPSGFADTSTGLPETPPDK